MQKSSLNLEKEITAEEHSPAYVCDWGPLNEQWWSQGTPQKISNISY